MKKIPHLIDWNLLAGAMKKEAGEASSMVRQKLQQTAEMAGAAAGMADMVEDGDSWVVDHVSTAHDDIMEVAGYLQSKAGPAGPIEVDVEPSGMMQTGFEGQDGSGMVGNMGASGNMTTSFDPEAKTSGSDGVIHTAGGRVGNHPRSALEALRGLLRSLEARPGSTRGSSAVNEAEMGLKILEELEHLHSNYWDLLRRHPTKIFSNSGEHVGTKSAPEGTTPNDIAEVDADIHEIAFKLDRVWDQYPKDLAQRIFGKPNALDAETYSLSDEERPHPAHVKGGKVSEKERIELRRPPRFSDDWFTEAVAGPRRDAELARSRSMKSTEAKTSGSDGVIHTAGKNKPTNPSLWARAKAEAKKKFDVYPSAYANGWAVQWYKKHGGGWKK